MDRSRSTDFFESVLRIARKIKRACFDCRDILDAYENKHSQEEWVEICLKYMGENE